MYHCFVKSKTKLNRKPSNMQLKYLQKEFFYKNDVTNNKL